MIPSSGMNRPRKIGGLRREWDQVSRFPGRLVSISLLLYRNASAPPLLKIADPKILSPFFQITEFTLFKDSEPMSMVDYNASKFL